MIPPHNAFLVIRNISVSAFWNRSRSWRVARGVSEGNLVKLRSTYSLTGPISSTRIVVVE
ncbi:hypothetical protein NQ317_013470 [Molorchus minor]|uniref:Uncharacterized protein n=1 Tax=Molorchus minor TaxID=1323400 RepID=A0ABQ9J5S0_9CUCU|nr:hypothetical protein NQ317_013470 [Molorchus minor]